MIEFVKFEHVELWHPYKAAQSKLQKKKHFDNFFPKNTTALSFSQYNELSMT